MNPKLKFHFALWMLICIFSAENLHSQNLQWVNTFSNNSLSGGSVYIKDMTTDVAGNLYVFGTFYETADFDPGPAKSLLTCSNGSMRDLFIAKYSNSGNLIFIKQLKGSGDPEKIVLDNNNNILIAGSLWGTMDFDPGMSVSNRTSNGGYDIFFARFDNAGNLQFASNIGSSSNDYGYSITSDNSQKIYITGSCFGSVDFDPGPGIYFSTGAGNSNLFYAVYDVNGVFNSVVSMGNAPGTYNRGKEILVNANGTVFLTGTFGGTIDFDPSGLSYNLTGSAADQFIAKYSATGNFIFAAKIVNNLTTNFAGMVKDNAGNIYITGTFASTVDFDPGVGVQPLTAISSDVYIAKYDSSWNFVFVKAIGSSFAEGSSDLGIDPAGNLLVTGYFTGTTDFDPGAGTWNLTNAGGNDVFIARYDVNGNFVTAKSIGSINDEMSESITSDLSGNIITGGYFTGQVDFDPNAGVQNLIPGNGLNTAFISKLNGTGNYIHAFMLGNVTDHVKDEGRCVRVGVNGSVYTTGIFNDTIDFDPGPGVQFRSSAGNNDIFITVNDASGNLLNAISIGGTGDDAGNAIVTDAVGNIYVTGYFSGTVDFAPGASVVNLTATNKDIYFAKYDAFLNLIFVQKIGGSLNEDAVTMVLDGSGNLILGGTYEGTVDFDPGAGTYAMAGGGGLCGFFAKYNSSGSLIFAKRIGNTGNNGIHSLVVDNSSNIFVAGFFNGTCDFDPGAGTQNLISAGSREAFFGKYDVSGNYVFAKRIGSTSWDECKAIALDGVGNIVITGTFSGTVDMDPGAATMNKTSTGGTDIFVSKYNAAGVHLFSQVIQGLEDEIVNAVAIDQFNNIYLTGSYYSGSLNFTGTGFSINGISYIKEKMFVARYGSNGMLVFAFQVDPSNNSSGKSLATDSSLNLFLTGYFSFIADFDPSGGNTASVSHSSNDLFLARYGYLSPLPVELLSFTAETEGEFVNCSWVTASESENDFFTVQRSKDGIHFENAGEAKGAGNSSSALSYQFKDTQPYSGVSYYRLQQTDFNGSTTLSDVVSVKFYEPEEEFQLFPNPSSGIFNFVLPEGKTADSKIRLRDLSGKLIFEKVFSNTGRLHTIDLNDFQAGFYLVEIVREGKSVFRKIQIVH